MARILVVEDEQMLARIIVMKLQDEGYDVVLATDGLQAYTYMSADPMPDLVLLDVLLPKMSGFEVLERMKSEAKSVSPVIMFSNFAQQEDVARAKELGALDYIVKAAFSPAEILAKVAQVLAAPAEVSAPVVGTPVSEMPAPMSPSPALGMQPVISDMAQSTAPAQQATSTYSRIDQAFVTPAVTPPPAPVPSTTTVQPIQVSVVSPEGQN